MSVTLCARKHLSGAHNVSKHAVPEEILLVEAFEPVTLMNFIKHGKGHMLTLIQLQMVSTQVAMEQVHGNLLKDI